MSWRAPQAWRAMVAPYSMSSGSRYRPLFGKYQTTASSMAPYSTPKKRLNTAAAGARKVAAEATTPHSTRSEEHTSELQSQSNLVCRLLLEKKKKKNSDHTCAQSAAITRT